MCLNEKMPSENVFQTASIYKGLLMSILKQYGLFITIFIFSLSTVPSLGYSVEDGTFLAMVCFWYALFQLNKSLFQIVFLLNLIVCTCFAPIAQLYGNINIGLIASAFETNSNESLEFISTLPLKSWLMGLTVFLSGLTVLFAASKQASKQANYTGLTITAS